MSGHTGTPTLEACDASRPNPGLLARLLRQFARPSGALGRVAGWIMASRGSNRERSLWSIRLLEVRPGDRVLEIGFGPGVAVAELARLAHEGRVCGIDHSETMLRMARRRNAAAIRAGRVDLRLARVEEMPAWGAPFDRVLSVNCVQFWSDPAARLAELRRRMAPGGRVALTLQPRQRGATNADAAARGRDLCALLERAGFPEVRLETLELQPVNAVCALAICPPG